jgi:hypothetical protein
MIIGSKDCYTGFTSKTESARVQPFKLPPHPFRTVYREGHFVAAPPRNEESPARTSPRVQPSKCSQQVRPATRNLPPHPFRTVFREGHFVAAPPRNEESPARISPRVQPSECPQQVMLATRNLPPRPFRTVDREGQFVVAPPPRRGKPRKNISEGSALQMLTASNARNEESPASPFPYRLQGRRVRSGSAPATRKAPQEYLRGSSPPDAHSK